MYRYEAKEYHTEKLSALGYESVMSMDALQLCCWLATKLKCHAWMNQMITLKDSIEIYGSPEEIFNGLVKVFSSTEDFKAWHKDHVRCQWLKGKPFEVGSILYVEEYLHKKLHKLKFVGTRLEPNRKIEFKLFLPASIVCTGGTFVIEPVGQKSAFVATLSFRMGWVFTMLAKNRVDAIKKHMKEEGKNLKNIIERDGVLSAEASIRKNAEQYLEDLT